MSETALFALMVVGVIVFIILGIGVMLARFYRKVDQGKALIVNKMQSEPLVTFTGGVVLPIFHRAEVMDIAVKTIEIDRRGKEGLICKDNIRADIKVTFFVRVNKTVNDVLKVAQSIGCARASDKETLEELFTAKFSEALKSVGKGLDFEELYTRRGKFRDDIIEVIGHDLNGYALEDAAIDYLEQTPIELLDPQNILDADGIRKITDITTRRNIATNELKQRERMDIGKQNLQSDEAIFRYDQQRADAEAKKQKEITIARARESEQAKRVQIEETLKSKKASEKAAEEAQIAEQIRARAVMVAEQARLREQGVEEVRVAKARELEDIQRKKETDVRDIEREQELEARKKQIADVVRERIAVEKTVAEEEERIKDLRAQAGAQRDKTIRIIGAEAEAQEVLVKELKKAEANEEVAKYEARKQLTIADAALEAADRDTRAKLRLVEAVQAEHAAEGLAEVRVKEADAAALEKQGLAKVRVRDAEVNVREREGTVEAEVIRLREVAQAEGLEKKGLAAAHIKEADAMAIRKQLQAEADGLREKGEAMKAMDGVGREHEEFRLKLDMEKEVALQSLKARVEVAARQAQVLGKAFKRAKLNIVGGDGQFFDRFVNAVGVGQAIDGVVDNSKSLQGLLKKQLNGETNLVQDLRGLLGSDTASSVKDLSMSAVLGRLAAGGDEAQRSEVNKLVERATELSLSEPQS